MQSQKIGFSAIQANCMYEGCRIVVNKTCTKSALIGQKGSIIDIFDKSIHGGGTHRVFGIEFDNGHKIPRLAVKKFGELGFLDFLKE